MSSYEFIFDDFGGEKASLELQCNFVGLFIRNISCLCWSNVCYNVTMRKGSLSYSNEAYLHAALLAVHASYGGKRFRASEFKFFTGLFSNWMSSFFEDGQLDLQNTQVIRLLEKLTNDALLSKAKGEREYQMTQAGLVESLRVVSSYSSLDRLDTFFFKFHFLCTYGDKIENMISKATKKLPRSYEIEIEHMLNPLNLIGTQRHFITEQIEKLNKRVSDIEKQVRYTDNQLNQRLPLDEILTNVAKNFPYELNAQVNMAELFKSLDSDIRYHELVVTPAMRAPTLWGPSLKYLENFLIQLDELEESIHE